MENKKNNGLVVAFIIVLVVAVLGIGGTLYFYNKEKLKCNDTSNVNKNMDIEKKDINRYDYFKYVLDNLSLDNFIFKEGDINIYLQFISTRNGFKLENVTNDDISETIHKFIFEYGINKNKESEIIDGQTYLHYILEKEQVDNLLKKYYNLDNYTLPDSIKEIAFNGKKYYQILVFAGESFSDYMFVTDVDTKNNEIYVDLHTILGVFDEKITKVKIKLNNNYNIQNITYE